MDFEVLGSISDLDTKQKLYGSGFLKLDRSVTGSEDNWRSLKVGKSDDFFASKEMLRSPLLRSDDGQQFLSFSSPNSETLPYHQYPLNRSTASAYGYGGLNGVLAGERGVFTPSQWMELEHQALIYKYITSNVPIPSNLLIPIRKAFDSVRFFSFSGGALRPNTLGWGGFHLGFSHNTDPEPGRCRRTDGKKWRCSRDAVANQKYCERHLNRGRHRSRKPVEGQTGHSVTGTTTTTSANLMPMPSTTSSLVGPGSGTYNGLNLSHQLESMETDAPNPCASSHINRTFLNKENLGERTLDSTGLSILSPTIGLKENQFSVPKQQNSYQESSQTQFGLVSSDSLLNPLHKSSSLTNGKIYGSSQGLNNEGNESRNSLHQFMDDQWPKNQSEMDLQSDRTQTNLSISIPVASNSCPGNENPTLSPLRLSRETNTRKVNWVVPTSWESSMGGPLGEVLHSNNSNAGEFKYSSGLNLMTKGWDSSSCLASSPNGVLQKMIFGSLSNSSAGSSPRAEQLL